MWSLLFAMTASAEPAPDVHIELVLSEDTAIIEMIKYVLTERLPELRECHTPRLAEIPDLAGAYTLEFTVLQDGAVGSPKATFVPDKESRPDEALRACLVERMAGWRFQRIRNDQPVRKTVTFQPPEPPAPVE